MPLTANSVTVSEEPEVVEAPRSVVEKILAAFPEEPLMLEVAYCESGVQTPTGCHGPINPSADNPNSSAKGVFQILDGTWAGYRCEGDPYDEDDNIECARRIWEARKLRDWEASAHAWR